MKFYFLLKNILSFLKIFVHNNAHLLPSCDKLKSAYTNRRATRDLCMCVKS